MYLQKPDPSQLQVAAMSSVTLKSREPLRSTAPAAIMVNKTQLDKPAFESGTV